MNKDKKLLIGIVFILLIIILFITIKIITNYKKSLKSNNNKIDIYSNNTISNLSVIKLYMDNDSNTIISVNNLRDDRYDNTYNYTYLNTYKCSNIDCKTYSYNILNNHIIIKDNDYIIYNYKNNTYKKINLLSNNYLDIKLLSFNDKDYGLALKNESNYYAFYSLKDKKLKSDYIYNDILSNEVSLMKNCFIAVINKDNLIKYDVVNYKDNITIKSFNNVIGSIGNKNEIYYYEKVNQDNKVIYSIYNDKLDKFKDEVYYHFGVTDAGNLVVSSDNISFKLYNEKGIFIKESKPYSEIYSVLDKYIIVKDNDSYLKIIDFDSNVIKKILYLNEDANYVSSKYMLKEDDKIINIFIEDNNKNIKTFSYSINNKSLKINN